MGERVIQHQNQRLSLISAYSNFLHFLLEGSKGSVNGLYSCFQTRAGEGPGAGSAPVWIRVFLRGFGLASMNVEHERACSRFASNVHLSLFSVSVSSSRGVGTRSSGQKNDGPVGPPCSRCHVSELSLGNQEYQLPPFCLLVLTASSVECLFFVGPLHISPARHERIVQVLHSSR